MIESGGCTIGISLLAFSPRTLAGAATYTVGLTRALVSQAPGRYAVFTLSGAVDIEIGDGTVRRLGPGDILIAEDLTGQGHITREVGPEPRASIFVPLPG